MFKEILKLHVQYLRASSVGYTFQNNLLNN